MDNQWLLYGISSVVLIILIRRTIPIRKHRIKLFVGSDFADSSSGSSSLCTAEKEKNEHTKELPSSKVHQ